MNSFKTIVVLSVILLRFDLTVVGKNVTSNKLFFEKCIDMDNEVSLKRMPENPAEYSRALLSGLKRFSIEILRSLHNFESKDSSKGLILSPFSIWSALLVTYMGARGETSKELRSVLGANNMPKHAVGISYQGLRLWYKVKANVSMAKGQSKSQPCSFANKIFINDNLPLTDCMKQYFGEEVQPMGFANDPGKARKKINAWVEGETRNKIKDLIPVGGITQWTTIVIANALYFHSKWQHQFDSSQTEMGSFHVSPTETVQVPYMKMTANLMYGVSETLGATLLELPYANQVTYSLLILLPDASKGIDSLVRKLEPTHLAEVMGNMYDDEISVVIPKFKAEQEFELAGPLYSMGVKKLFDPRFSDLSGFVADPTMSVSKSKDGNTTVNPTITSHGVTVNSVVHKVFISVDEEGTEAAAATAILMARSGRPAFPTRFVVDRPFLFLIRDTATDIILFIGIVRRPNET